MLRSRVRGVGLSGLPGINVAASPGRPCRGRAARGAERRAGAAAPALGQLRCARGERRHRLPPGPPAAPRPGHGGGAVAVPTHSGDTEGPPTPRDV